MIGADRMAPMLDGIDFADDSFLLYNIEVVDENRYRIALTLAGFKLKELEIERGNQLRITGRRCGGEGEGEVEPNYRCQGIAEHGFDRNFLLADHMEVLGAELQDGLLHIDLVREILEAMKPRKIAIQTADVIESS